MPPPLPWQVNSLPIISESNRAEVPSLQRQLTNYRENLLLIEERMSEYVEFTQIPLQLIRNRRLTEAKIVELEKRRS